MVNQHDPPLDQFDLFKRKHSRQNKDFVRSLFLQANSNTRAHSIQAQRIKSLETENRRLLDENLAFRTENVALKCQLARQAQVIESARSTQSALDRILNDITGVKTGLDESLQNVRPGGHVDSSNVNSRGVKKTVKARRRAEIQVDELTELKFDEFKEERKNKLKALSSGLEAPFSDSPRVSVSETDASDSEEDLEPEDIIISEQSRTPAISVPSRRHSLSIPNNLANPATTTTTAIKRTTLKNPPTREKASTTQHSPLNTQPLETTPPPAKDNPRKRRRSEMFTSTTSVNNKENFDILPPPVESDLFSPMKTGNNNEKAQRGVLVESSPTRPSIIIPAGLTSLESPNKPMNHGMMTVKDLVMSPLRMATGMAKEVPGERFSEFMLDMEEGGGRRVSRARKQVNYALPNLRDKMRREDNLERGGRQRSRSMDRSVTPEMEVMTVEELSTRPPPQAVKESIVKPEPEPTPVRMVTKPTTIQSQSVRPQTSQPVSSSQPDKRPATANVKPRLSLIERQSLSNTSSSTSTSASISRHSTEPSKKRRISSLHQPLPFSKTTVQPTLLPLTDLFRFPSESPPKHPTKPTPSHRPAPPVSRPISDSDSSDKENVAPLTSWPVVVGGRERRKTFTITMEKMARMSQEEMQLDKEWESSLANKRRRQSVAL